MNSRIAFACMLLVAACGGGSPDDASDAEAESAPVQLDGKADTKSFLGIFESRAATHEAGDLTALELDAASVKPGAPANTVYVRQRCYHAACALPLPETDNYDVYTSSSGKTYVRFWSFTVVVDPVGGNGQAPKIADVYEIKRTTSGIKLRKSAASRWVTLYKTTAQRTCTTSGGSWSGADCACAAGFVFVPGAGGCIVSPGADESNCDASNGLWTDDDASRTGSFCLCGLGRYDDATGSCTAI